MCESLRVLTAAGLISLCLVATSLFGEPPKEQKPKEDPAQTATKSDPAEDVKKSAITVQVARQRAELLHTAFEATLIAVHRAYFEGERDAVPAVVLEDVFSWVDKETHGKTRWIAVNTEAMNIDHEPKSDFEKKAAKALAAGNESFELIEDGVYHRAGAVSLVTGCLRCHETGLIQRRQRKRVAGLVISIPFKP